MYTLNIASTIKKMLVNGFRDFIFENYYTQIGFSKENSYYSKNIREKNPQEKILDHRTAKEHYQSFIRKENTKSIKQ